MTDPSRQAQPVVAEPRYRPALVALHWTLAVLVLAMLAIGFLVLAPLANADPAKVAVVRWHMIGGFATLVTLVVFLVSRWRMGAPERLTAGSRGLDRLATAVHRSFYGVIALMAVSGIATSALAGLPPIVFGGASDRLPASLELLPSLKAHGVLALLLATMIVLHVGGALYHQIVRRDRLLGRMGLSS